MRIRKEKPGEYGAIYDLVKTAFETARVREGDEQDYVDGLRAGGNYVPELSLVAEEDGGLVGHVMLTRTKLVTDDGRDVGVLLIALLSVLIEYRDRGIGARLTREALRRAAEMGFEGVFLAGNPDYYGRFGFRRADSFGVNYTGAIPPQLVLALELRPGALTVGNIDGSTEGSSG